MKIKIYLPHFLHRDNVDEDGYLEMNPGSKLRDVYRKLRIPVLFCSIVFAYVNNEKASLDTPLEEGDIVSFVSFISGG